MLTPSTIRKTLNDLLATVNRTCPYQSESRSIFLTELNQKIFDILKNVQKKEEQMKKENEEIRSTLSRCKKDIFEQLGHSSQLDSENTTISNKYNISYISKPISYQFNNISIERSFLESELVKMNKLRMVVEHERARLIESIIHIHKYMFGDSDCEYFKCECTFTFSPKKAIDLPFSDISSDTETHDWNKGLDKGIILDDIARNDILSNNNEIYDQKGDTGENREKYKHGMKETEIKENKEKMDMSDTDTIHNGTQERESDKENVFNSLDIEKEENKASQSKNNKYEAEADESNQNWNINNGTNTFTCENEQKISHEYLERHPPTLSHCDLQTLREIKKTFEQRRRNVIPLRSKILRYLRRKETITEYNLNDVLPQKLKNFSDPKINNFRLSSFHELNRIMLLIKQKKNWLKQKKIKIKRKIIDLCNIMDIPYHDDTQTLSMPQCFEIMDISNHHDEISIPYKTRPIRKSEYGQYQTCSEICLGVLNVKQLEFIRNGLKCQFSRSFDLIFCKIESELKEISEIFGLAIPELRSNKESLILMKKIITDLKDRKDSHKKIIQLIDNRSKLIHNIEQFEGQAKNPERLRGSSIRLLEEEKFRKKMNYSLLVLERELMEKLKEYYTLWNEPFLYNGNIYEEILKQEINGRILTRNIYRKI